MAGLAARRRIIVLVRRTDQVQRRAYREQFGKHVRFVENSRELYSELEKAENRFVVTVGHVEGENFVMRGADGSVSLKEPLARVQQTVDDAQSVGLQLGCEVAAGAPMSGPVLPIDALELAKALKISVTSKTPQEFFERLSETIGPIHLETDLNGRLRAVSTGPVTTTKNVVAVNTVRGSISRAARLPRTAGAILIPFSAWFAGIGIVSWILLLMAEDSRRHAWRALEERYAAAVDLELRDVLPLSRAETISIFIFGPPFYCVRLTGLLLLNGAMAALGLFTIVTIALVAVCNPAALEQSSTTTRLNEWLHPALRNARGASLLILLIVAPLRWIGSVLLERAHAGGTANIVLWIMVISAAAFAVVLSRSRPWLLRGDDLLLRAALWPSDVLFKSIALVRWAVSGISRKLWTPSTR